MGSSDRSSSDRLLQQRGHDIDAREQHNVRCRRCAYELFGLQGTTCPECGLEFDPLDRDSVQLPHPSTISGRVVLGSIVLALVLAVSALKSLRSGLL